MLQQFKNRTEAGKILSGYLNNHLDRNQQPLLLALPRGGVPVAFEVSQRLNLPLEVIISRKIGHPHSPEYGLGAIAEPDVVWFNQSHLHKAHLTPQDLMTTIERERQELQRRIDLYRQGKQLEHLKARQIILIDDGLATGVTAMAAIHSLKKLGVSNIVYATPVCSPQTTADLEKLVDEVICILMPDHLRSIGQYYQNFDQVTDEEVIQFLTDSHRPRQNNYQPDPPRLNPHTRG
jgi:putative phosphoribosyl transferase